MATKKQQQCFYESALELALKLGAKNKHTGRLASEYELETKAGKLSIHFKEPEASNVFTIFCKFDNPEKAKDAVIEKERLNIFSGKYNFHYFNPDELLYYFEKEIKPILINSVITNF
jgi:hypothetical protein